MKQVLVVGGAGYIGSHVNKMLNQAGYQTVVFDNLSRGDQRSVTHGIFVEGDLAFPDDLDKLFRNYSFDAVLHFAALTDVGESVHNPALYYRNNVAYTLNLLSAMVRYNINHLVFSSSAAIFGIPKDKLIKESHPVHPINPYGQSKLMVETILKDFDQAYGLRSCSLRYFNAAGGDPDGQIKNFKKKENNLIPLTLKSLLDPKGKITVFGTDYPTPDGTCIRDYIHVCDLGEAHILGMEKLLGGSSSSHYNLGNGRGYSVLEVIKAAETVTGLKVNAIKGPRRAGDPAVLVADSSKAESELGWQPKYPDLETMIDHAWKAEIKAKG